MDNIDDSEMNEQKARYVQNVSLCTKYKQICDIRPEWPKCNLCRIRILSSKPSELMISRD